MSVGHVEAAVRSELAMKRFSFPEESELGAEVHGWPHTTLSLSLPFHPQVVGERRRKKR